MSERRQSDFDTVFEVKPLERGFGHTMGFALRRTMLGLLSSYAICGVRISNVDHEFQTIEGLIEDGVELILNLKSIKFTMDKEPTERQKEEVYSFYTKMSPEARELKVSDFKFENNFHPVNPEQVIARAASDLSERESPLEIEIFVRYDKGFTDFQENKRYFEKQIIKIPSKIQSGRFIAVDSDFSPVENVVFKVEELNSASSDIEECLTLEVKTDGRVSAVSALNMASQILAGGFAFASDVQTLKNQLFSSEMSKNEKNDVINDPIIRIGLSKRAENALRGENINTVQALMDYGDLEMIENIGKKTAQEIRDKLKDYLEKRRKVEIDEELEKHTFVVAEDMIEESSIAEEGNG